MKYLSAYIKAWAKMVTVFGPIYLIIAAAEAERFLPMFLVYLATVASLAGPLSVWLNNGEKGKVCVK